MAAPNSGFTYTRTIPLLGPDAGIIEIDFADFVSETADIFHIEIEGGGLLRGFRLVENGIVLAPSAETWYTTWTISAAVGTSITLEHMDGGVTAGQQLYCPTFLGATIGDEHDLFCRYKYFAPAARWASKVNSWIGA